MAASLRAGLIVVAGIVAGVLIPSCSPPPAPADEIVARIVQFGLGDQPDRFTRVAIELRPLDDDAAVTSVLLDASERTRVAWPDGKTTVVTAAGSRTWSGSSPSRESTSAEREAALRLGGLCRAALFTPLLDASPSRSDDETIRLSDEWELSHAGFEPRGLTSSALGSVRFHELGRAPALGLPRVADFDGTGIRRIRVLGDRTEFAEDAFEPPENREQHAPDIVISAEETPEEPVFQRIERCRWLLLDDPGSWADRLAAISRHGKRLSAAGQSNAGDPILFDDAGRAMLAIPFRKNVGAADYVAAEGEVVRTVAASTAAVVYCAAGPFERRVAHGEIMLRTFVQQSGQRVAGPLRTIVDIYFLRDLTEGSETERTMDLRLELPIDS